MPATVRFIMTMTWPRKEIFRAPQSADLTSQSYVGQEGEGAEDEVSSFSKPRPDDLEESLGTRGSHFQHDGQDGEYDDLDGGSTSIPIWPTDPVLAGHSRGLEQSGRPCPLRHDGGGRQTNGDLASSVKGGVEIVRIMVDIFTNLKHSAFRSLRSWTGRNVGRKYLRKL